jgi:hypothetical protein
MKYPVWISVSESRTHLVICQRSAVSDINSRSVRGILTWDRESELLWLLSALPTFLDKTWSGSFEPID